MAQQIEVWRNSEQKEFEDDLYPKFDAMGDLPVNLLSKMRKT